MTSFSLLAPVLDALPPGQRSALLAAVPAAFGVAAVLVLITAAAVLALVVEVRRDGYGLERPRPLSAEFPWQTEAAARRRRMRSRDSWRLLRTSRTAHR
jgi:hypothetical protein